MKERPILFSGAMVLAILSGAKTQTRRVVKPVMTPPRVAPLHMEPWMIDGEQEMDDHGLPCWCGSHPDYPTGEKWFSCPYGQPGDRLWVRETHAIVPVTAYRASAGVPQTVNPATPHDAAIYRAGWVRSDPGVGWRPSIHMPRWASRITLELTDVRVERVQDISAADKAAEGLHEADGYGPAAFSDLWDRINGQRGYGWATNPWVWVIEFRGV